jgi:anti-anti-sigma factor
MDITVTDRDGARIISVVGSVDASTAETLTEELKKLIDQGKACLVADFTQVDYISSAGLRSLLATVKEARNQGGDLLLASVTGDVQKVLKLSGFTSIIKIYPDVNAALSSLGS